MKFHFSWLKRHLHTELSAPEIANIMVQAGVEVEGLDIIDVNRDFKIAKIIKAQPHPNSSKLTMCSVYDGENTIQILCGGCNVEDGMMVVIAPVGSHLKDMKIESKEMGGHMSNGVILSASEISSSLDLKNNKSEILPLNCSEQYIGKSFADVYQYNEYVFDVCLTPNRSDWMSVRGVARDLSCFEGCTFIDNYESSKLIYSKDISIDCEGDVSYFAMQAFLNKDALLTANIPLFIANSMRYAGIDHTSCNAIQAIAEYVKHDCGAPINTILRHGDIRAVSVHENAFLCEIVDDKRQPISASPGSLITHINSATTALTSMMAIESCEGVDSTSIYFETADIPAKYIQHVQQPGDKNDTLKRFLRGVDENILEKAMCKLSELLSGFCSDFKFYRAGRLESLQRIIKISDYADYRQELQAINNYKDILARIGCKEAQQGTFTIPSWRHDLVNVQSLYSEVLRINNQCNNFLYSSSNASSSNACISKNNDLLIKENYNAGMRIKSALAMHKMQEVILLPFIDIKSGLLFAEPSNGSDDFIVLKNPIDVSKGIMRNTLMPGMLDALQNCINRKFHSISIFELGNCFSKKFQHQQRLFVAGMRYGSRNYKNWHHKNEDFDFFTIKNDVEHLLQPYKQDISFIKPANARSYMDPYQCLEVMYKGVMIGFFGALHPYVLLAMNVKKATKSTYCFHIDVSKFDMIDTNTPLNSFPSKTNIVKDFSFLMKESVSAEELQNHALEVNDCILSANVFDIYTDNDGSYMSLEVVISQDMLSANKSLLVNDVYNAIIRHIKNKTGCEIRS